ncbi:NAD(P)-dependent oxidoreductase [Agrococcus carbonis]|uniref:2-hydroxy-3-oxopropionate reductase n=1 Tax=Agrococcus carbonis TaxID=684552 RepID=A0A1H1PVX1_9MICO|nr:NAD(P)-dependent oxidoreductase [Agrococcus carbonis]SDS15380.1 2-hydroxy-3-oxopropionate reductase [Agrococcus carbonis]
MGRSISLIGLGAMGLPMARLLAARGALSVHNRSAARAHALAAEAPSVAVAERPADAAAGVVLTVLPDLPDVEAVVHGTEGLLAGWRAASVDRPMLVVMGTVSPVALRALAQELAEHGVEVVDAPMSGGVLGAAEGRLSVFVGGSAEAAAELAAVLEPCASRVTHMGPTGAGATTKLCNQLVVAETIAALSEAFALARASGIDPMALADALGSGLAGSEALRQKRQHWIAEEFAPGGTIDYQVKDLRYAQQAADAAGLRLRAAQTALALFEDASASGDGGLDHTGVYRQVLRD